MDGVRNCRSLTPKSLAEALRWGTFCCRSRHHLHFQCGYQGFGFQETQVQPPSARLPVGPEIGQCARGRPAVPRHEGAARCCRHKLLGDKRFGSPDPASPGPPERVFLRSWLESRGIWSGLAPTYSMRDFRKTWPKISPRRRREENRDGYFPLRSSAVSFSTARRSQARA